MLRQAQQTSVMYRRLPTPFPRCPNHATPTANARAERTPNSAKAGQPPPAPLPPAKAGRMGLDGQRARRQAVDRFDVVVAARRHVVRRVGVEDRGEVLDLAAADAELELAAAIALD